MKQYCQYSVILFVALLFQDPTVIMCQLKPEDVSPRFSCSVDLRSGAKIILAQHKNTCMAGSRVAKTQDQTNEQGTKRAKKLS